MTAPLVSDRPLYEGGAFGAAPLRYRRKPSSTLVLSRLRRGARRQWPLFIAVLLLVAGLGITYSLEAGAAPLSTALFWAPFAFAVGLSAALVVELGRNTVTSLSSFGKHRGYSILGASPELNARTLRQLPPDQRTPLGCLAFHPASPFATAFRDLQSTVSQDSLVAYVGSLPGEGATTAALCTAVSAAQQGRSVIIVDCDLRRRSLSRALGGEADAGVIGACNAPDRWRSFVEEEQETGLHFIGAPPMQNPWATLVGSRGFPLLLDQLCDAYELVILDCPPARGAEGLVIASLANKCVVVTAWDRTPVSAVRDTMRALHRHARSIITGVYVNRVPAGYRFGRLRGED